ncbi:MAG: outer membrane protein transport protein [Verrucomicrobiota bacterium]
MQNVFPQMISAGVNYQITDRVRAIFQVDWVNWADAFDELEVYLNNGDNTAINGVLGTANIYDIIPLRWEDQLVYRVGVDFQATESIALRAGYCYGNSPVPDSTLTPMTAAIMEHKFSIGAGWKSERYFVDAGYQYSLPTTQDVTLSALRSGEYSNSRTKVDVHTFALTVGMNF